MTLRGRQSFLDTNILVYAMQPLQSLKKDRAKAIMESALSKHDAVISFQVVQEFLSVALRKFRPPMSQLETRSYLDEVLMPLCEVYPTQSLYERALSIVEETGWSFYDSLIVSAAIAADCDRVLTEDLQHGRNVRGVEIQNPFL